MMKERLKRNQHSRHLSDKQGQFSFVMVVCNGDGQESNHPGRLAHQPQHHFSEHRPKRHLSSAQEKRSGSVGDWGPLAV